MLSLIKSSKPYTLFNKLCLPAKIYVILTLITTFVVYYQNYNDRNKYCIGIFTTKSICDNRLFFVCKFLYLVFWTFVLQKLCSKGYTAISWLILLLPLVLMFVLMGFLFIFMMKYKHM